MLNFWNLPRWLRPKIWPKEGQKFSKIQKNFLIEDKKNYRKITFFGGSSKPKKTNKQMSEVIFCLFQQKMVILL